MTHGWMPLATEAQLFAGNLEQAEALARAGVAASPVTDRAYASTRAVFLAHVLLRRGDLDSADHYLNLCDSLALDANVPVQVRPQKRTSAPARADKRSPRGRGRSGREPRDRITHGCGLPKRQDALRRVERSSQLAGKREAAEEQVSAGRELLRRKGATALLADLDAQQRGALASSSRATSRLAASACAAAAGHVPLPHGTGSFLSVRPRSSGAQTAQSPRPNERLTAAKRRYG